MKHNVAITGIGVVSPIGIGRDSYWKALANGESGFKPITLFNTSNSNVHCAGEITDFDPITLLGKKGLRDLDRSTRLVCAAAKLAIDDSRLEITDDNTHATGVSVGSTFGSLHSISQFDRVGLIEGPKFVNPSHFPNTVLNSPASQVSIRFKIKGFNTTVSTGFCASIDAVSYAADFIRLERARVVLSGGVEELCEETFLGFYTLGCLSGSDGSKPICSPFDKRRNGTILSEGSAILVLENEANALQRGAAIRAQIMGYGNAFDPAADLSFTHEGAGLKKAISLALEDASIAPSDVDCIFANANSTKHLDSMETRVIKEVFRSHAPAIPVTAIKSMIGETFSASGSLALSAAVGAIETGIIPPIINFREGDTECDLNYVVKEPFNKEITNAIVISSDPYGNNSAMVLGKYGA